MKVLVWLSVNDAEATASKVVEVLPGTGLTVPFGELPGWAGRALADVTVVLEPEPVAAPAGGMGIVTQAQLEGAFAKWAGAGVNPDGLPVRDLAWTVWRAAYYWSLVQRAEGYAAAMAALDRKEEPRT